MSMRITNDPTALIDAMNLTMEGAVDEAMDEASEAMLGFIHFAFVVDGPGWKELHPYTIFRKQLSGAYDPFKILEEFRIMRRSLTIKNTTRATIKLRRGNKIVYNRPNGYNIRPDTYISVVNRREIGLFSDKSLKYDPAKEVGFRGPLDVVSRGMKHEFGGFEYQTLMYKGYVAGKSFFTGRIGIEEIVTGGLNRKSLKGEGTLIDYQRDVRKRMVSKRKPGKISHTKGKGKNVKYHQWVYIPERSFLRNPFDRHVNMLINIIEDKIREWVDFYW